jgi:hypothetical protein
LSGRFGASVATKASNEIAGLLTKSSWGFLGTLKHDFCLHQREPVGEKPGSNLNNEQSNHLPRPRFYLLNATTVRLRIVKPTEAKDKDVIRICNDF